MSQRIGDFLVEIGAMTSDQVDSVLALQKAGDDRMFGEIAIASGYIDDKALKSYVDRPKQ